MISRKSAMAIANAYTNKFSHKPSSSSGQREKVYRDSLYDFLYEHEYEAWFCNLAKHNFKVRELQEFFLKIHTGESLANATPKWTWEQRAALGQNYLKNLSRDYILFYSKLPDSWYTKYYQTYFDDLSRRLEIDGYIFKDNDLYQTEVEILDVEAEAGLLEKLHVALNLSERHQTFQFLKLSEEHYIAGRWSDCISNSRKFFEAILKQVALKYSELKQCPLSESNLTRPVAIRDFLENEELIEKNEREAIDKIYGLLSHTGGQPYMAEKEQARLLRQICLTMTQFVMLRLEGAGNKL